MIPPVPSPPVLRGEGWGEGSLHFVFLVTDAF